MADIGRMSIGVSANTTAFTAAMNGSVAQANAMSNSVARAMDKAFTATGKQLPAPKMPTLPTLSVHAQIDMGGIANQAAKVANQVQSTFDANPAKVHPGAALLAGGVAGAALARTPTQQATLQKAVIPQSAASALPLAPVAALAAIPLAKAHREQKLKLPNVPQGIPTNLPQGIPLQQGQQPGGASISISAMLGGMPAQESPTAQAAKAVAQQRTLYQRLTGTGWLDDLQSKTGAGIKAFGGFLGSKLTEAYAAARQPIRTGGNVLAGSISTTTDIVGAATSGLGKVLGSAIGGGGGGLRGFLGGSLSIAGRATGAGIQVLGRAAGLAAQGVGILAQHTANLAVTLTGSLLRPITSIARYLFSWTAPLAAAGAGFLIFQRGSQDILQTDVQARRLGVSILDVRTAMLAGGVAGQSMIEAMDELGSKSALLVRGNMEVIASFRNLTALSGQGFGMTVPQLATMDTVQQFDAIAIRIQAIKDPMSQATAAARIFGKAWVDILPTLREGGGGLEAAREQARKFGLAVSAVDVSNVQAASRVFRDLGAIWAGLQNQFTLGIAPIVAEIRKAVDFSKIDLSGFKNTVIDVAHRVGQLGAAMIDAWSNTSMIKDAWEAALHFIRAGILGMVGEASIQFGKLVSKIPFTGNTGKELVTSGQSDIDLSKGLFKGATENLGNMWKRWQKNPAMQRLNQAFENIRERANPPEVKPAVAAPVDLAAKGFQGAWQAMGLDKNPALIGLNRSIDKLWQAMGAKDAAGGIAYNPALVNQLTDQFRQMQQGAMSPLETFRQKMRDLNVMQGAGMFAGDPGMLAKMQFQGFQQAAQGVTTDASGVKLAGAAEKYSREAYSSIVRAQSGQIKNTVPEVLRAIAEQEKAQREAQLELTRQLLDALKNQPLPEVAKI